MGLSWKLVAIQFVVMLALVGVGYAYFNHTQARIEQLVKDKEQLEAAVKTQTETILAQQAAAQRQNAEIGTLQLSTARAEGTRRELEARLRRTDLQARARADSVGLETRINRATVQAFRDIETLTAPRDRPAPPPAPETVSPASSSTPANPTSQPAAPAASSPSRASARPPTSTAGSAGSPQPPPRPPVTRNAQ